MTRDGPVSPTTSIGSPNSPASARPGIRSSAAGWIWPGRNGRRRTGRLGALLALILILSIAGMSLAGINIAVGVALTVSGVVLLGGAVMTVPRTQPGLGNRAHHRHRGDRDP